MGYLKVPEIKALFSNFDLVFTNFDNIFKFLEFLLILVDLICLEKRNFTKNCMSPFYEAQTPNFGRANSPNLWGL